MLKKTILSIIINLITIVIVFGQPTNLPQPGRLSIAVDATGALVDPTNFFTVNSNLNYTIFPQFERTSPFVLTNIKHIDFNTNYTPSTKVGRIYWDIPEGTFTVGLKTNVNGQLFKEMFIYARNNSGQTITNGSLVYISGALGSKATVELASSTNYNTASKTLAMATEDVLNNEDGIFTTEGEVHDLPTSEFLDGAELYLSEVRGRFTTNMPTGTNAKVCIGVVTRSHNNQGVVYVKIRPHSSVQDLSGVNIGTPSANDGLVWNGTVWTNGAVSSSINTNNFLGINSTNLGGYSISMTNTDATFSMYSLLSSPSDYLKFVVKKSGNNFVIGSEAAGAGVGDGAVTLMTGGTNRVTIEKSGIVNIRTSPYRLKLGDDAENNYIQRSVFSQSLEFFCGGVKRVIMDDSPSTYGISVFAVHTAISSIGNATPLSIFPSVALNSSKDGANLNLTGGAASTVGNWNGGNVEINGGVLNGSGTNGMVRVGFVRKTDLLINGTTTIGTNSSTATVFNPSGLGTNTLSGQTTISNLIQPVLEDTLTNNQIVPLNTAAYIYYTNSCPTNNLNLYFTNALVGRAVQIYITGITNNAITNINYNFSGEFRWFTWTNVYVSTNKVLALSITPLRTNLLHVAGKEDAR